MRQCLLGILLIGLSAGLHAQGRQDLTQSTYKNTLKVNLTSLALGSLSIHKEKVIDPNNSLTVWGYGCNYLYANQIFVFGIGAGYRSYFKGQEKNSLYAEPYLRYQYLTIPDASVSVNTLSAGFVGGKRWFLGNRLTLELFFGPSLNFGAVDEGNGSVIFPDYMGPLNGVAARTGINFGFRY